MDKERGGKKAETHKRNLEEMVETQRKKEAETMERRAKEGGRNYGEES